MKLRTTLFVIFAACSLRTFAAEGTRLAVQLALEPSRVLPGIPASLRVVVANDGSTPVVIPDRVLLRVIPSNGKPFVAEWGTGQEHRFSGATMSVADPDRSIPAHSERTFLFSATEFGHPGWFYDPRLNSPGTYRFQLLIGAFDENTVSSVSALEVQRDVAGGFASNEAVLTVEVPRGDDALLWNHLVALTKHKASAWSPLYWSPAEAHDFASIAVKYPASPYAAYAVPYFWSPSPDERRAALQRVFDAQPSAPIRDNIQMLIAEAEVAAAQQAAKGPELGLAITLYDRARADFEQVERNATDAGIRARSREEREHLPTVQELKETIPPPGSGVR